MKLARRQESKQVEKDEVGLQTFASDTSPPAVTGIYIKSRVSTADPVAPNMKHGG